MSARRRRLLIAAHADHDDTSALPESAVMPAPRKPKTNSSTRPQIPQAAPSVDWPRRLASLVFRPRLLVLLALVISALVLGPRLQLFLPDLSQRDEYRLFSSQIEINEPPRWVPPDLVDQVVDLAGLPETVSVLDSQLTAQVAEAFERHPWVAAVVHVRKSVPAHMTVELRYRRPVAMVEAKQGMYPVDAQGVLLPPADFSVAQTRRYPAIQNVRSTPQGPAGTNWGDLHVVAAARLADVLLEPAEDEESRWKRFHLAAIQVAPADGQSPQWDDIVLELLTEGGSRIIWGRPPGSTHPGELSTEQKLGRLDKYRTDFGGFDQPHGPYEIDIRHWQEISRRPMAARPPPPRS